MPGPEDEPAAHAELWALEPPPVAANGPPPEWVPPTMQEAAGLTKQLDVLARLVGLGAVTVVSGDMAVQQHAVAAGLRATAVQSRPVMEAGSAARSNFGLEDLPTLWAILERAAEPLAPELSLAVRARGWLSASGAAMQEDEAARVRGGGGGEGG